MKYNKETLKDKSVRIELELDSKEWEEAIQKAYEKEASNYDMEGFRKGKAPRKVIEQKHGKGVFYETAINDAFQKYYGEFLQKEKDFEPVGQPTLDIKKADDEGAIILVTTDVKPEVKLGQYKDLEVDKNPEEITDAQVDADLKVEQDKAARTEKVDRASKKGDTVNMDFTGKMAGETFEGGTAEKYDLVIGSNSFIPGFEDQLIGLKEGDTKVIKVKFPDDYHSDKLKGKDVEFDVNVNSIKEKQMPKLDDKFAKDSSEFETLDEWKVDIKKKLKEQADKDADIKAENELIDKITDNSEVDVPESMVKEQLDAFIKDFEHKLQHQGMKLEDYLKMTGSSMDELKKSKHDEAVKTVKTRLALDAIMKKEDIKVTEEEFNKKLEDIAKAQGMDVKKVKEQFNQEHLNYFYNNLIVEKLLKFLKDNNKIK